MDPHFRHDNQPVNLTRVNFRETKIYTATLDLLQRKPQQSYKFHFMDLDLGNSQLSVIWTFGILTTCWQHLLSHQCWRRVWWCPPSFYGWLSLENVWHKLFSWSGSFVFLWNRYRTTSEGNRQLSWHQQPLQSMSKGKEMQTSLYMLFPSMLPEDLYRLTWWSG